MWESLQYLAKVRKQKHLVKQKYEAAFQRLTQTTEWREYNIFRKFLRSIEREEESQMLIVADQAAHLLDKYVKWDFPEEVDLKQHVTRHIEIQDNLGHLIRVNTNLN